MNDVVANESTFHLNELVSLIREVDPRLLEALKQNIPSIRKQLESGVTLGSEEVRHTDLEVAKETGIFAGKVLRSASQTCRKAIEIATGKTRDAKRLRVVGQCLATIGSSGVIVSVAAKVQGVLICGLLALFSSLMSLFADYRGSILADGSTAEKALRELVPLLFDVDMQANKLDVLLERAPTSELAKAVNTANDIARRVFVLALPITGWKA
jgi:hypothetical protein